MVTASVDVLSGDGVGHVGVSDYTRLVLSSLPNSTSFLEVYVPSDSSSKTGTQMLRYDWSRTFTRVFFAQNQKLPTSRCICKSDEISESDDSVGKNDIDHG